MKQKSLFDVLVPAEKLNPNFHKILPQSTGEDFHAPTRAALQESFGALPKPDGNFIKDFQTTGFDGRVWELYLHAMFRSIGLSVAQPHDRPDFLLCNERESVWVEAVTANPSQVISETNPAAEFWAGLDEVAIKLGGPLTDKLKKQYWELPHVSGMPLVLAIADFHDPSFGFRTSVYALERYAYGLSARLTSSVGEEVTYVQEKIAEHVGRKVIPSEFFSLPGSENVSALLFSNAGTIAKFSRMGFLKNPVKGILLLRCGTKYDDNSTAIMPKGFAYLVGEYPEEWNDEAVVLHNPRATQPLPENFFGTTAECFAEKDAVSFFRVKDYFYASVTEKLLCPIADESFYRERLREQGKGWVQKMDATRREMEEQVVKAHRSKMPQDGLSSITVTELFKAAGLQPCGPVPWDKPVTEKKPGVYVIAIVPRPDDGCGPVDVAYLPPGVATRWVPSQPVIYIGRTKRSLSRRIDEFYRHVYGKRSPHRGGQAVKLLTCPRWVYWAPTEHGAVAEDKMIGRFKVKVGRLPFANRVRSARVKDNSK